MRPKGVTLAHKEAAGASGTPQTAAKEAAGETPNPNVQPPPFVWLSKGYDPDAPNPDGSGTKDTRTDGKLKPLP